MSSRPFLRSSSVMTLRLRWRRSWTSFSTRRTRRRLARAQRRTVLLRQCLDSSLLREKEQEQLLSQQLHRLSEMADSRQFHSPEPSSPLLLPETTVSGFLLPPEQTRT